MRDEINDSGQTFNFSTNGLKVSGESDEILEKLIDVFTEFFWFRRKFNNPRVTLKGSNKFYLFLIPLSRNLKIALKFSIISECKEYQVFRIRQPKFRLYPILIFLLVVIITSFIPIINIIMGIIGILLTIGCIIFIPYLKKNKEMIVKQIIPTLCKEINAEIVDLNMINNKQH